MSQELERIFPALRGTDYAVTSRRTTGYNCIAWAAGDSRRWWEPVDCAYWPDTATREMTVDAYIEAYATIGYAKCENDSLEDGIDKVAIYAKNGRPTHAARQLLDGKWTSKCGKGEDISHTLEGLSGNCYGAPVAFLARPRPTSDSTT